MNSDLKPCPRCGERERLGFLSSRNGGLVRVRVFCDRCGFSPSPFAFIDHDALEIWNIESELAWKNHKHKTSLNSNEALAELVPDKTIRHLEKPLGWSVEVAFQKRPENIVGTWMFPLIARITSEAHEKVWFPLCRLGRSDFTIISELEKADTVPDWMQIMYLDKLVFDLRAALKRGSGE